MKRILLSHRPPPNSLPDVNGYEFTCPPHAESFTHGQVREMLTGYDAFLCIMEYPFPAGLMDAGPGLRAIGVAGAGYDNVDWKYATEKRIAVVNAPQAVREPTAALTMALILGVTRGIVRFHNELKTTRKCEKWPFYEGDMDIYGKTLGIVGLGNIGKAVAQKAAAFGMAVQYYDRWRMAPEVEAACGARYAELDELFATSDVVTLHAPNLEENHHLVNARRLALMKPGAYLVNAARGRLMDERALAAAVREGIIRGAACDVFEFEPEVTAELAQLDNVIIVPHIGTNLSEVRVAMMNEALGGVFRCLEGDLPPNAVNAEALRGHK